VSSGSGFRRDGQFYRFAAYGFLKNLRFFEPFIILYFREAGFSFLQIGVLYSIREVSTVVLEVPTGFIADIGGRKTSMIMSMAAYITSFTTFFLFRSFESAAGAMVLFAVGEAFRTGTHKAMILEYLRMTDQEEWKPDYYGATRAASMLGSALNALIAAAMVFISGSYRYIFLAAALPCVLNIINLASYPPALDRDGSRKGASRISFRESLHHSMVMLRDASARLSVLNSASFDAFFKVLKEYLQPVLRAAALSVPLLSALADRQRTALLAGGVYFLLFLMASTASRYSGRMSRRASGVGAAMNLTWMAAAATLMVAGISQYRSMFFVTISAYLVLYVLQNLRRPLCVSCISDRVDSRIMSVGLSVESLTKTLLMAVLAPLCGYGADRLGIGPMIALSAIIMAAIYFPLRLRTTGSGRQDVQPTPGPPPPA